jgi:hypothetical protein
MTTLQKTNTPQEDGSMRDAIRKRVESDHLRVPRGQVYMKGQQDQSPNGPIARLQEMLREQGLLSDDDIRRDGQGRFNDRTQRGLMALQQELKERGLYNGEINGRYGPGTAEAFAQLREKQLEEEINRRRGNADTKGHETDGGKSQESPGCTPPGGCINTPNSGGLPETPNPCQPSIDELLKPSDRQPPQGGVQNMQGRRVDRNANREAEDRARREASKLKPNPQISQGTDCPPGTEPRNNAPARPNPPSREILF